MLIHLSIKNYALIEDLQVSFHEGFSTITGETGAGKSIFLESLSLILGKRADRSALRDEAGKCIIEGTFDIRDYTYLRVFFQRHELDYEGETILRREIHPNGKSRAFINDSPVTLDILSKLGVQLVDIHSQHQTLELTEHSFQLRVIDALAQNSELLMRYQEVRKGYLETLAKVQALETNREQALKEQDYNLFLLEELDGIQLDEGKQEALEQKLEILENAASINESLQLASQLLSEEQMGLISQSVQLRQLLNRLSSYGGNFKEAAERFQSIYLELEDLQQEILRLEEQQVTDPAELESVRTQLTTRYHLHAKHKASSDTELIAIRESLREQVDQNHNLDGNIQKLRELLTGQESTLNTISEELHQRRLAVLPEFKVTLESQLRDLGIPNADFHLNLHSTDSFNPKGKDRFEMLFTANKGGSHGELKKTASGGELSRIMLVIKSILAAHEKLPTIMFDEIDTGVSGEISNKMGDIMLQMSENMQVFAITHLAQVASKGQYQFKVFKEDDTYRTYTRMKTLSQEERVVELAEMLGGKSVTDAALIHARQLLN